MTEHFLHRHYDPPVYGDRPEPWQLYYTCGGCGEELWTDEEGHGSTVGTPDDALQQHLDELELQAVARHMNLQGCTCGHHQPGEYDRCSTCQSICDDLAQRLIDAGAETLPRTHRTELTR